MRLALKVLVTDGRMKSRAVRIFFQIPARYTRDCPDGCDCFDFAAAGTQMNRKLESTRHVQDTFLQGFLINVHAFLDDQGFCSHKLLHQI